VNGPKINADSWCNLIFRWNRHSECLFHNGNPLVVNLQGIGNLYESLYETVEKEKVIYSGIRPSKPEFSVYNYNSICHARETQGPLKGQNWLGSMEQINYLYSFRKGRIGKKSWKRATHVIFKKVKEGCPALYGFWRISYTRNDGWHFGTIGQLIERGPTTHVYFRCKISHLTKQTPQCRALPST